MSHTHVHLRYELSRTQRLVPHLLIWWPYLLASAILIMVSIVLSIWISFWFVGFTLLLIWLIRGFIAGLIDVVLRPVRRMDVLVEDNGLGFLVDGERWWLPLDGIRWFKQLRPDVWTLMHHNGTVINIPVTMVTDEQIDQIRNAAAEGGPSP